MKKVTIGTFASRGDAERAINHVHNELDVDKEDISYIYKNTEGDIKEVDSAKISSDKPSEGMRKGAAIGGTIGALAGIAAVAGLIPGLGVFLVAGPLYSLLGVTTAVGTAAVGAAAGAAGGGIIGALVNLGVGKEQAQEYSDRVNAGDVLVSVYSDKKIDVAKVLTKYGATNVEIFKTTI